MPPRTPSRDEPSSAILRGESERQELRRSEEDDVLVLAVLVFADQLADLVRERLGDLVVRVLLEPSLLPLGGAVDQLGISVSRSWRSFPPWRALRNFAMALRCS
jgi:hypothetical protein